jgi:hypothetical protein
MKKFILLLILANISCKGQEAKKIDLSNKSEMNYIFARISNSKPTSKWIYNYGLHINIFKLSDSKATKKSLFEGYDGIVASYMISIAPDGNYYTWSKLYKIEALVNPKILEIKETKYPNFILKIEEGFYDNRKVRKFKIVGR